MNYNTYDRIGREYDRTRKADPYLAGRFSELLRQRNDGDFLDAGCGSGNYSIALARFGGKWFGLDSSSVMIDAATRKSSTVTFTVGSIDQAPYAPASFDGILAVLMLHHLPSYASSLVRMRKLLRLNGRIVIFSATQEQMSGYWLNHYFPIAMKRSIGQMPTEAELQSVVAASGLRNVHREDYRVRTDLVDAFLYSGKSRPDIYLDKAYREGMSTFANLASADEVALGVKRLREDLECSRFESVAMKYSKISKGDYFILVLQKDEVD